MYCKRLLSRLTTTDSFWPSAANLITSFERDFFPRTSRFSRDIRDFPIYFESLAALTAVGKEVVARARQVLAAAEDLSDFASDASRPMQGQLRLGVIPTIAPFVLPTVMPALREKFPQLQLALREDLTAHLLERLRDRQLDFALIALPYDTDDLRVQSLYKDKFWLVGREQDPAITGKAIQLSSAWT